MYTLIWIEHSWMWFCIAFGAALLLALLMDRVGSVFMTKDRTLRKFTIIDLEFPSNPRDIPGIINGIFKLPDSDQQRKVEQALKRVLYLDFLFMPAVYGAIFLLCMQVAGKFPPGALGQKFFSTLAWLQAVALLCDIAENWMLYMRIKPDLKEMPRRSFQVFVGVVWLKWATALVGGVTASMITLYFLIKGDYNLRSLMFLMIIVIEIALFFILQLFLSRQKK